MFVKTEDITFIKKLIRMHKLIFSSFTLLSSCLLFAQTAEPLEISDKPYQIQAGINVVTFVRQFVNFSGNTNNLPPNPYALNIKVFKQLANKSSLIGLRFGSGYVNANSESATVSNSSSNIIETLDLRVGIEYQSMITKKWVAYVGFDYISQKGINNSLSKFTNQGSPTEIVTSNDRTTVMDGAGFVFGMQFNINKRIALSTEATYYYSDSWSKTTTFSSNNQNNQPPFIGKNKSTNLILPNLLNFIVVF